MLWNKRVYYDKNTGEVVTITGGFEGLPERYTADYEFEIYPVLKERVRESMDFLNLEIGQYEQDFLESNVYRVNTETKELEFSYPNPNEPESPQVFQKPLSEEVERLKAEDLNNKEAIAELYLLSMGGF